MDEKLTPEQLVERMRKYGVGGLLSNGELQQAADLIESQSAELKDAKLEWGVASRLDNGNLQSFLSCENHKEALEKLSIMQNSVVGRTFELMTRADWMAECRAEELGVQSKQLDVAAKEWDTYQDCRYCPNHGGKACGVASDRRCSEIIREHWAEEAAKR